MPTREEEEAAHAAAATRATGSPIGIGAAYSGEITENDRDGWRGVVAVSDGTTDVRIMLLAGGHASWRGMPVDSEALAALVERFAGSFPVQTRLADLQAATVEGPGLRLDSRYPDDWAAVTRNAPRLT